jgi:secreted trypsin-like serine protease
LEIKLIGKDELIPFQVGITSFGSGISCGEAKVPAVYTRVSSYIKWIETHVKESFDPVG